MYAAVPNPMPPDITVVITQIQDILVYSSYAILLSTPKTILETVEYRGWRSLDRMVAHPLPMLIIGSMRVRMVFQSQNAHMCTPKLTINSILRILLIQDAFDFGTGPHVMNADG